MRSATKTTTHHRPTQPNRLQRGDPSALLPLLHHALLRYSRHVARQLVDAGLEVKERALLARGQRQRPAAATTAALSCAHS